MSTEIEQRGLNFSKIFPTGWHPYTFPDSPGKSLFPLKCARSEEVRAANIINLKQVIKLFFTKYFKYAFYFKKYFCLNKAQRNLRSSIS